MIFMKGHREHDHDHHHHHHDHEVKHRHRPLVEHRLLSSICFVLLLASFVLLLLVGISLPIVKGVYILRVYADTNVPATSIATELRFGVWGVCASSILHPPTWLTNDGECFGPQLGYKIPESIYTLAGLSSSIVSAIQTGVLVVLVLHLVAAGFAFVTLFSALFLASHVLSILALLLSIISALLTTVMLGVDLALVIETKNNLPKYTNNGFKVGYGNAVWMVLVAVVLTWVSVVLLSARVCYCCGVRRRHRY